MCCRTEIFPLDPKLAAMILQIGRFKQVGETVWEREVLEEGTTVTATLFEANNCLTLNITPAISVMAHHAGKRNTAGIYFEIAAKYAEKVGGEVFQRANVSGCAVPNNHKGLLLASYPSLPMSYDRICNGFQQIFLPN